MSGWISVKDRMPESYEIGVLAIDAQGRFSLASWFPEPVTNETTWRGWRVWHVLHPDYGGGVVDGGPTGNITHWMPLPDPPK